MIEPTSADRVKAMREDARDSIEYWTESAVIDVTEELAEVMRSDDVSRAELARRVGTSPAYITKVLRGDANFTLATMVKLARAFKRVVRIHFAPESSHRTRWVDELDGGRGWWTELQAPLGGETVRKLQRANVRSTDTSAADYAA